ncbi:unnamed protein product [Prorocentrum cordatum]|uniref:Thioredoxin domain-containing protein n=1 Tax=Prorocentrum cordatum TaxID=2364126 RepID=A0ABN9V7N6_9DINO|nr:unnamed protein product [Polarella glacialis]
MDVMAPSGAPPRRSAQRARAWPARTEARHRRRLAAALAALLVAAVAATGASDQCRLSAPEGRRRLGAVSGGDRRPPGRRGEERHGSPCFFAALRRTLAPSGPPSGPPDSGLPSSTPGDLVAQLKTGTPVVVDITAKWCGPCKVMEKTMVSLSNKYAGKVLAALGAAACVVYWAFSCMHQLANESKLCAFLARRRGGSSTEASRAIASRTHIESVVMTRVGVIRC